jgi:hypothetical protein
MSKEFMEAAMANVKRLGDCRGGHLFQEIPHCLVKWGKKYECSKCGGMIDRAAHYWYMLGRSHGGGK